MTPQENELLTKILDRLTSIEDRLEEYDSIYSFNQVHLLVNQMKIASKLGVKTTAPKYLDTSEAQKEYAEYKEQREEIKKIL